MSIQLPSPTSNQPAPLSHTISAGVPVANAIKTSIATVAGAAHYTTFNGALAGGPFAPCRTVSVTSSTSVGSYTAGSAVLFTGTDASGAAQTETLLLTATGGNETISGTKAFLTITDINIEAQADTSGAFTFGVRDLVPIPTPRKVRCGGTGDLAVKYADGTTDTILSVLAGETLNISPTKILAATTATKITLLY